MLKTFDPQPRTSRLARNARRSAPDAFPRRRFLRTLAPALAAPLVLPASVLGRAGAAAPSERINVGMIGTGNQGTFHTKVLTRLAEVQVVAVCDPDRGKRQTAREITELAYAQARAAGAYKGCQDYNDFRDLLARPDIDAVFIASPEHWHALQTIAAAQAGKDVYCEKAMAKTIAESQAMVKAIRRHQRVFQVGTQQRSAPQFRQACELVRNGYLGQLRTIKIGDPKGYPGPSIREEKVPEGLDYDLWLGPAPWSPYFPERLENLKGWMLCYDYTVGFPSGWGQHEIDIAQWANGTDHTGPVEVECQAAFSSDGLNTGLSTWHAEYTYANGVRLVFASDNENPHGIRFEGGEGWLFVNRNGLQAEPKSLLTAGFKSGDTRLYESQHHHLDFLKAVKSRKDPICPVETGHHTYVICNLCDIAGRLGRKLRWDPGQERFPSDEAANAMLSRPMRAPWHL